MKAYASALVSAMILGFSRRAHSSTVVVDTLRASVIHTHVISHPPASATDAALYYAFEEDLGAAVMDSTSNAYDAAAFACAWNSGGKHVGGAMAFNGSNSSINAGKDINFPMWAQYSVSVWFLHNGGGYHGSSQYGHKILDKTSMYHDWCLRVHPLGNKPGNVNLALYEQGAVFGISDSSKNFMDGMWHHVAVTRNGVGIQLWVDGKLSDSRAGAFSVNSSSALCVGNSFSTDPFQRTAWSGMLDEIQIYNRVLSDEEISRLYRTGALFRHPVSIASGLNVAGALTVGGEAVFSGGISRILPLGDLSSGSYTNAP